MKAQCRSGSIRMKRISPNLQGGVLGTPPPAPPVPPQVRSAGERGRAGEQGLGDWAWSHAHRLKAPCSTFLLILGVMFPTQRG